MHIIYSNFANNLARQLTQYRCLCAETMCQCHVNLMFEFRIRMPRTCDLITETSALTVLSLEGYITKTLRVQWNPRFGFHTRNSDSIKNSEITKLPFLPFMLEWPLVCLNEVDTCTEPLPQRELAGRMFLLPLLWFTQVILDTENTTI